VNEATLVAALATALSLPEDMVIVLPSGSEQPIWLAVAVVQEIVPLELLMVLPSVWTTPFTEELAVGTAIVTAPVCAEPLAPFAVNGAVAEMVVIGAPGNNCTQSVPLYCTSV
jgi:hypothetical protein